MLNMLPRIIYPREMVIKKGSLIRLKFLDGKKAFIICGGQSFEKSGSEEKLSHYLKNLSVERFCDFEVNPNIKDVVTGVKIIKTFQPDLIIGIGGGSVIDIAKLINIFAVHVSTKKEIYDFVNKSSSVINKGLPLLAIPTTSGTGVKQLISL